MKSAIRVFNILTLLVLSFCASAYELQQDPVVVAKTNISENIPTSGALANCVPITVTNATSKENVIKVEHDSSYNFIDTRYKTAVARLKQKASSIQEYAKSHNYSSDYVFLIDMSLPSGKNRFFVYNLKKDSLEHSALVAHGFGSTVKNSEDQLIFSNNDYSFKTSLGKYKIGNSYNGTYGLAYKLYGLDSSNSKAFERAIVLHSDVHMPAKEIYPYKIFQSAGCPTVAPTFLPVLGKYIKSSKKPILMWIYN